jgi:hypothetical protein
MSSNEFHNLLGELSSRVLAVFSSDAEECLEDVERIALQGGSLWLAPASKLEISDAEHRLGIELPDDYKSFLQFSNGAVLPGLENHTAKLLPAGSIGRFSRVDPGAFDSWVCSDLVMVTGDEPIVALQWMSDDVEMFRYDYPPQVEAFLQSIVISEVVGTAAVLICPFLQTTGECAYETWVVGPWMGCIRYRSFEHFIRHHLDAFVREESM